MSRIIVHNNNEVRKKVLGRYHWVAIICILGIQSCVKDIDEYKAPDGTAVVTDMQQLQILATFNYDLTKNLTLTINVLTSNDQPIPGVKIRIMTDTPENNGEILFTGSTNSSGTLNQTFKITKTIQQVIVNTDFIGLPNNAVVDVQGNYLNLTLGSSNPQQFAISNPNSRNYIQNTSSFKTSTIPNKIYMGTWNAQGLPNYLVSPRDVVSGSFLNRITQSLPERRPVPVYTPQYIANNVSSSLSVNQNADLWMTFVHEGAGFRNTIGYYKYHKNNPPQSTSDIANINIVFPNFSYTNCGGSLITGDKVHIGTCGVDTVIGFVLLANSYNLSTALVENGHAQYYSDNNLNPETVTSERAHNVLLWDSLEQKMVIGFEDLHRSYGSDDDFNDAVFYMSSYPANAIYSNLVNNVNPGIDSDADGVPDIQDDYPSDPTLAYNTFYPGSNTFGHLAFEDLWPYRGDYDLNDLIVGYKFNCIQNASNQIKKIKAQLFVKAAGGSFKHGFGIELPLPPAFIQSVTGSLLTENYISLNANGTEAGQSNAVLIAFDNSTNLATRPAGYYINTEPGSPIVISDTVTLEITLINGVPISNLGSAPFNSFLISNMTRGKEIHMADKMPTSLADPSLFNTGQDRTNPALGRYYKSDINLPWCINIPDNYGIVTEKNKIIDAYLKFSNWVQSGGVSYPDWYQNLPGYRDESKILNR
ncbi:MAG: LruC domain-containing protein [Bacteroidetes bacterium]|nr:LruC domain-containing protein [Bacteroidota bacterium]